MNTATILSLKSRQLKIINLFRCCQNINPTYTILTIFSNLSIVLLKFKQNQPFFHCITRKHFEFFSIYLQIFNIFFVLYFNKHIIFCIFSFFPLIFVQMRSASLYFMHLLKNFKIYLFYSFICVDNKNCTYIKNRIFFLLYYTIYYSLMFYARSAKKAYRKI